MQVSCPHCGTQYSLTAKQVGPAGRTLQCAKCQHKWFVAPAGAAEAARAQTLADAPPPLPPSSAPTGITIDGLPNLDELASIGSGPRWWRSLRGNWAPELTLTIAGMVVALTAIFGFNWLLRYTPPPESATIAAVGATPTHQPGPQPSGLILSNLTREVAQRGTSTVLVIRGTLTNDTGAAATLPDLRVQLLDHDGVELDYWPVSYVTPTLAPQQSTQWQVTFVNPQLARVAAYRAFFAEGSAANQTVTTTLDRAPHQE